MSIYSDSLASDEMADPVKSEEELAAHRRQTDVINSLRCVFGDEGEYGWLSTLVWNVRNQYLTWPEGTHSAAQVQTLVEGFLAEIEALKSGSEDVPRAPWALAERRR